MSGTTRRCSFCLKTVADVRRLAAGQTAFICDGCLDGCRDMLQALQGGNAAWRLPSLVCSFCGKNERRYVLAGSIQGAYICDECVGHLRTAN